MQRGVVKRMDQVRLNGTGHVSGERRVLLLQGNAKVLLC